MNDRNEAARDEGLDLIVYLGLLVLTAATLGAAAVGGDGRIVTVSVALIIASAKAALIGFYFMDLRREKTMVYVILAVGLLAVGSLLAGILPDLTFARF